MLKKILCILMCLVMFMSFNTIAFAADLDTAETMEVQPRFSYINSVFTRIEYVGNGKVNCFAYATGYDGVTTKIGIDVYLQKKVLLWWVNTDYEWHTLAPGHYAEIKAYNYVLPSKGTYRVKATITAYYGSVTETCESESKQYTYGG